MSRKGMKYCQWSETDMKEALKKYKTGRFGLNEICSMYNVPKPTLKRHLASSNMKAKEGVKPLGRCTVFSAEIEKQLEDQILKLEECFYGVTIRDILKAAFDFAEQNNSTHNFNRNIRMAGKKWFYQFMKRHPNISLRQPEATSLARSKGFNRENVHGFFNLLEKVVDENHLDATKIFNVDESGFSTVQKNCQKILARKGKHQVGTIASGERGVNTTMVVCTSVSGQYVAPMIIFKRKRMMPELGMGAPPGCLVVISDTGYINSDLFVVWLQGFIDVGKPSIDSKVLLVLDGHTTHSKTLKAVQLARQNGVIMLQLPGHTTHRLQPLDVAVFKPLEGYYNQSVEKWMREHSGLGVTQFRVAQILGEAYSKAATIANAINGFRKCGIWPVDRDVFSDVDFAPSHALQKVSTSNTIEVNNNSVQDSDTSDNDDDIPLSEVRKKMQVPRLDISFEDIIPMPKVKEEGKKRKSKGAQKSQVLTTTLYKDELEARVSASGQDKRCAVKRRICSTSPTPSTSGRSVKITSWNQNS